MLCSQPFVAQCISDDLHKSVPHRCRYLNTQSQEGGFLWAGLGGVVLLEEVFLCGDNLRHAQVMPSVTHNLLMLPVVQDVELLAYPAPHLSGCCHDSYPEDNGLNP